VDPSNLEWIACISLKEKFNLIILAANVAQMKRNPGCSKPNIPDYGCACIRATLASLRSVRHEAHYY